jgi:hypothetical protein
MIGLQQSTCYAFHDVIDIVYLIKSLITHAAVVFFFRKTIDATKDINIFANNVPSQLVVRSQLIVQSRTQTQ